MREHLFNVFAWSIVGWLFVFLVCLGSLEIRRELRGGYDTFDIWGQDVK